LFNMGRELQKRKNRSSIPKKRQKPKSKKQLLHNPIIAANWNSKETPSQNYRRLGLVSKLNKSTGGKEKTAANLPDPDESSDDGLQDDPLAINPARQAQRSTTDEVIIERDSHTGAILRVVNSATSNPLNDSLNELDEASAIDFNSLGRLPKRQPGQDRNTDVTRQLEQYAANGVKRKPRDQSGREEEWIGRLVDKHGDDYRAMFWDKKLNVFQQSEGDIKRRVRRWREKQR